MTTDTFFSLACVAIMALFFGSVLAFNGYRFFLFLLPIWGFFFGFGVGAQAVQAIFGTGFLTDVTSWVVGFVVAVIFAVLSYLFYFFAVALIGGSLGYALGIGIMLAITPNLTIIPWIVGVVVGIIFAIAVTVLNIQKLVIIVATSMMGSTVIVGAMLLILGRLPSAVLTDPAANPVQSVIQDSAFWSIMYIVIVVIAIAAQMAATRRWQIEEYNRWEEFQAGTAKA